MHSDPNLKMIKIFLFLLSHLSLSLLDAIDHGQSTSHDLVALLDLDLDVPLALVDVCCVAHDDVSVANSLHFEDFVLDCKLIEASKDLL